MTKLIERNTTIPTKKGEKFTTAEDSQPAVTVHVLQGEREMASDNKTLARFELAGIPPAARGVPQIEVSFDIDANGIVNVSAKDTSTGKEQSIRITASSGLSQEEIEKLVKEAELHASEDSRKRELADARNSADTRIYTTEKLINENGDDIDPAFKVEVEGALENLKRATEGEDPDEIRRLTEVLTQASHKMSEAMYQKASADGREDGHGYDEKTGQQGPPASEEEVIDADYREVA
jgi:molecular chaperone DnaK